MLCGIFARQKNICKIAIPKLLCSSVRNVCNRAEVKVKYYSIDTDFMPLNIELESDEWLYIVNYYGQIGNEAIIKLKKKI